MAFRRQHAPGNAMVSTQEPDLAREKGGSRKREGRKGEEGEGRRRGRRGEGEQREGGGRRGRKGTCSEPGPPPWPGEMTRKGRGEGGRREGRRREEGSSQVASAGSTGQRAAGFSDCNG